jgi:hypothetical protein
MLKNLLIFLSSSAWILVLLASSNRFIGRETGFDEVWIVSLTAMMQQGEISGRDFHFTYGLLPQLLGLLATMFTKSGGALDSYAMIGFFWSVTAVMLVGCAMSLIKELNWRDCLVVYFSMMLLRLFSIVYFSYRSVIPILCAVIIYRTITAHSIRSRNLWAIILGLFLFISQLVTPELSIYGLCSAVIIFLIYAFQLKIFQLYKSLIVVFSVFLGANLAIGLFFSLTNHPFTNIFAYHFFLYELVIGYKRTMGYVWDVDLLSTKLIFAVLLFTFISAVSLIKQLSLEKSAIIISLLVVSLFCLNGALIRSDVIHLVHSATPAVFLFLVIGVINISKTPENIRNFRNGFSLFWLVNLSLLFSSWPTAGAEEFKTLSSVIKGDISLGDNWQEMRKRKVQWRDWIPSSILTSLNDYPEYSVLSFPYDNYLSLLTERRIVAPVLQSYAAMTEKMEQWYVNKLKEERELLVLYNVNSWIVDEVPPATRTPLIFEYLLKNFQLEINNANKSGIYLLIPRSKTRQLYLSKIDYVLTKPRENSLVLKLDSKASCSLLRLDLVITYPFSEVLFRPNPLEFGISSNESKTIISSWVLPLKINKVFSTYIPLVPNINTHQLFSENASEGIFVNKINIVPKKTDWIGVDPSSIAVSNIQCVIH